MKRVALLLALLIPVSWPSLQAKTYTIDTFVSRVRSSGSDMKLARKELEKSEVTTDEAWAVVLPKMFGKAEYKRNMEDNYLYMDMPNMMGGTTSLKIKTNKKNDFVYSLVVSQPIYSAKIGSALQAADQFAELSDFVYKATDQAVGVAARKVFYQGLLLRNVWQVSRSSERQAKDSYLHVQSRYKNGVASEFEMLQAEIGWKNEIPKVTENQRNYQLLLANMKTLADLPAQEEIKLEGNFQKYPAYPKRIDLETILERRQDFQALLMEKKLKRTDIKAQQADHLPTLDASLIYAEAGSSDDFKMENENKSFIAGLTLNIPIYSGGYTSAQVRKSKLELSKTEINIEKTRREIETEVGNIYIRLTEAEQRIRSAQSTRKTAEKAYTIGKVQSENGLITQLQLKDARIFLEQAQLNYFSAVFDYLNAYLDWQLATGRGEG